MKRQTTRLPDGEKDFAFRFGYQPDNDDVQHSPFMTFYERTSTVKSYPRKAIW